MTECPICNGSIQATAKAWLVDVEICDDSGDVLDASLMDGGSMEAYCPESFEVYCENGHTLEQMQQQAATLDANTEDALYLQSIGADVPADLLPGEAEHIIGGTRVTDSDLDAAQRIADREAQS